jgi:hypothetical protein
MALPIALGQIQAVDTVVDIVIRWLITQLACCRATSRSAGRVGRPRMEPEGPAAQVFGLDEGPRLSTMRHGARIQRETALALRGLRPAKCYGRLRRGNGRRRRAGISPALLYCRGRARRRLQTRRSHPVSQNREAAEGVSEVQRIIAYGPHPRSVSHYGAGCSVRIYAVQSSETAPRSCHFVVRIAKCVEESPSRITHPASMSTNRRRAGKPE